MASGHPRVINFIIGNHAPCVVTEDIFEYIVQGVRGAGGSIHYSVGDYLVDAINIVMEGALITSAQSFASMRLSHPASRLYLIPTEILTLYVAIRAALAPAAGVWKKAGDNPSESSAPFTTM